MSTRTPNEILNYVLENHLESAFLSSVAGHVDGFSIGEITDRQFRKTASGYRLQSAGYRLDVNITDDDVLTALHNGLYVSAFISRNQDTYRLHFLCHQYPESMKSRFDDPIANEVIRYIILTTIVSLRLDSVKKIDNYVHR